MKVCINCGKQVNETDKFCPNCGNKLLSDSQSSNEIEIIKLKICDLCGEENPFNSEECNYCGVGFSGKEKVIEKEITNVKTFETINLTQQKNQKISKSSSSKKKEKTSQKVESSSPKKLETKHYIFLAIFVLGIFLLFLYHSFEPETKQVVNQQPQIQNQPQVDLNAINEINRLEEEVKNNPNDKDNLLRLANLLHDSRFFERAISYYEKYLKLNPNDFDAQVDMGVCYFELQQLEKASSIFESVIKKNPKHQIAYLNLGIVALTKGEVEKSKEYFKKCIELGEHTDAGHRAAELLKSH
ncbi:MAG: tetratricopeptide repeat protein [Ignavibacteria bacterium]|nr:tetratricopeptide repeat protein [Ignavibacteria bacterium]